MSNQNKSNTAPGAIWSLIASMIASVVLMLANTAASLASVPFVVPFLIAPSLAVIAGIVAIYYGMKSLRFIHQFKAFNEPGHEKLAGKKRSITAVVIGMISLIISLIVIIVFFMWAHERRTAPRKPVGMTDVRFYGDERHNDTAKQTILLPDSTLLTSGYSNPNDSLKSGRVVLLKTDLAGNKLWTKKLRGTEGKVAMLNDSTIIACRIISNPGKDDTARDSLVIHRLSLKGEISDTLVIQLGKGATISAVQPIRSGGAVVVGVSDRGEGKYKGRSYLFRTDGQYGKQSLRTFPQIMTGSPSGLAVASDGSVFISGFTDETVTDSTGTKAIRYWALTKISRDGDLVWNKPDLTEPDIMPVDLKITAVGELYILGQAIGDTKVPYSILLKLDLEGEIIWSKRVTGEGWYLASALAERLGGWIVIGSTRKYQLHTTISQRRDYWWNSYFISLINSEGEIEHEFDGRGTQFSALGITEISKNSWVITGAGNAGNLKAVQNVKLRDKDIGILHYTYSPDEE